MTALDAWGREKCLAPPAPVASEMQLLWERLKRVEARLDGRLGRVESTLKKLEGSPTGPLTPRYPWVPRVAAVIAEQWQVPARALLGSERIGPLIRPRFVLTWVVRQSGDLSLQETARAVRYGDHTSVIHAINRVQQWRDEDPEFALLTDRLLEIGRRIRAESAAELRQKATALLAEARAADATGAKATSVAGSPMQEAAE
jgi:hypothetical protein